MPRGVYGHQNGAALGEGHPRFLARAERARVWDVDGNEYVDWMCAYGPMILGYGHPAVESAVAEQVAAGDCLPLPGPRMVELAERLVALTPRADLVVFGKNGADATSWAVDVARAHTGRPRIVRARGAYHAARPWALPHLPGVPAHYRDDLLEFAWNDLDELRALFVEHPGEIAVVMTTPFDHQTGAAPAPGFFAGLRALCDEHGALFAMDDVRAGFRFHLGGSCEHWGAAPDLICYSKATANGHPLSAALAREALRGAAERVYFTGSFFFASGAFAARAGHPRGARAHRRHRADPADRRAAGDGPRRAGPAPRGPDAPARSARDAGDPLPGGPGAPAHPPLVLARHPGRGLRASGPQLVRLGGPHRGGRGPHPGGLRASVPDGGGGGLTPSPCRLPRGEWPTRRIVEGVRLSGLKG